MKFFLFTYLRSAAIAIFILAGLFLSLHGHASANHALPAVACKRSGTVVASPNVGTNTNVLEGVAGISTTDVWGVGFYIYTNLGVAKGPKLTKNQGGEQRRVIRSPSVGTLN